MTTQNVGKDTEKLDGSYSARNENSTATLEKSLEVSLKTKHATLYNNSAIAFMGIYLREMKH